MSALDPLSHGSSQRKERIAYLDNARYWVMLLVVVGHSLTELVIMDSARGVYTWIYMFHMPFFVLISGYTARGYTGSYSQVRRIVSTLIVPYLLVETTLQLITRYYDGEPAQLMILSPQWLGWFLAALLVWRLTTPIWRTLKYPISVSVIISLTAGLIEIPNVLALPKILGLLPFYVLGLHFSKDILAQLTRTRVRIASWVVLISSFVACLLWAERWSERWPTSWLLWKHRYNEPPLSVDAIEGMITRGWVLTIAFVLTMAALSVIPRRRSWTTAFGERTLYAYLLHGYVILFLDRQFGLWEKIEPYGVVAVAGCILGGLILANILMTSLIGKVFKPFFEPKLNWLFRRPPARD